MINDDECASCALDRDQRQREIKAEADGYMSSLMDANGQINWQEAYNGLNMILTTVLMSAGGSVFVSNELLDTTMASYPAEIQYTCDGINVIAKGVVIND